MAKEPYMGIPRFEKVYNDFTKLKSIKIQLEELLRGMKEMRRLSKAQREELMMGLKYVLEVTEDFERVIPQPDNIKGVEIKKKKQAKKKKNPEKKKKTKAPKEKPEKKKKVIPKEKETDTHHFDHKIRSLKDEFEKIKKELRE